MGTRADFYVGIKDKAEWLGSIPYDGYPDGVPMEYGIVVCVSEEAYRAAVSKMLDTYEYSTKPEKGWPWPWNDSDTTDYAYTWHNGRVQASCFGHPLFDAVDPEPDDDDTPRGGLWPDMSAIKNVATGDRSGLIILTAPVGEP